MAKDNKNTKVGPKSSADSSDIRRKKNALESLAEGEGRTVRGDIANRPKSQKPKDKK